MTLTKKIVLAITGLLLVVLAGLAWLVLTFDANRYKGVAIDWMREHHQRTLAIGDIRLGVLPGLQLELNQVTLSEAGAPAQRFAALDSAKLAMQLLPLLRGQLVVDQVEAAGLSLDFRRDEHGRTNLDDLLRADPAPTDNSPATASKPLQFDISGVQLERIRLAIDDRQAHLKGTAQLASLKTGRLSPQTPAPVSLAAEVQLDEPKLTARVQGSLQLQLDPGDGQTRPLQLQTRAVTLQIGGDLPGLSGLNAHLSGAFGYTAGLPVTAAASAAPVAASAGSAPGRMPDTALQSAATVTAAPLQIQLSVQAGPLQLKDSTLALERFEFHPAQQHMQLDLLALRLQGALTSAGQAPQPLQLDLDWPQLAVRGQQLQGSALSGRFALQGPAALAGQISSGTPSGSFEAIRVPALKLALGVETGGAAASRVRGALQTDVSVRVPTRQIALDALAIDATVQNPALRPLKVEARGRVEADPTHAQWDLAGQMNAQAFDLEGRLGLGGKVPQLQASARFGELDLDALLPPRPATAASASSGSASPPTADAPIDLSGLRAVNASVSLEAGTLKYQPYVMHDLSARAELQDGRLQLSPLRLKIWDGSLDARLNLDTGSTPAQQHLALQATAQDILIQSLLKDVSQTDLLEGRGQLKLDVQTGGASVNALKAALGGNAALQLHDGAIRGINLAQKLREAKAILSLDQDATTRARETEKTDFSALSATFKIARGVAANRDLDVRSPFLRLSGSGQVDLPQGRIDYTTRTTLANTTKGQGGADASALAGLTVPVQLVGPFTALDWKILWTEVAVGAAGNTLKQAGRDLKDKARVELRSKEDELKARAAEKIGLKASDAASAPLKEQLKDKAREAAQDKLKELFGR